MSKNYTMVQYAFPPLATVSNPALGEAILNIADTYIKDGKMAMGGSSLLYKSAKWYVSENKPIPDYRISHVSNRIGSETAPWNTVPPQWDPNVEQLFYRIFFDAAAAEEFCQSMTNLGALFAGIIVEGQSTPALDFQYLDSLFAPEDRVAKFVWPGYPNFDYQGTYPAAGPADATPWPSN